MHPVIPQNKRDESLTFFAGGPFRENYVFLANPKNSTGPRSGEKLRAYPLGEGGSGSVFLLNQKLFDSVAIKRAVKFFVYRDNIAKAINATLAISQKEFIREVVNYSALSHEGLVKIIDAGVEPVPFGECPFIVTDFIEGPTLRQLIESFRSRKGTDSLSKYRERLLQKPHLLLGLLIQVARAIKYMHEQRRYHFDIAPKNIFLKENDDFRPILGDFGLSTSFEELAKRPRVVGTREYMPPSIASKYLQHVSREEYQKFQPRWDIFSFAKSALELAHHVPDKNRFRWRKPLLASLKSCLLDEDDGPEIGNFDALVAQLEWLSPVGRVPELGLGSGQLRKIIPIDSPIISERLRKLTNHPSVLRLAKVPQLTMAKHVFPGANHTCYEHALGTMETMRRYLLALVESPDFLTRLNSPEIETALICGLLLNLTQHPLHHVLRESPELLPQSKPLFGKEEIFNKLFFRRTNSSSETLKQILDSNFPEVDQELVRNIVLGNQSKCTTPQASLVFSMLRGSLSAHVADFVRRDALHLGVSGYAFELEDMLSQLTVNKDKLALRVGGIGSAERLITMRHWLFNQFYWNSPNRSYVCMLKYCIYRLGKKRTSSRR